MSHLLKVPLRNMLLILIIVPFRNMSSTFCKNIILFGTFSCVTKGNIYNRCRFLKEVIELKGIGDRIKRLRENLKETDKKWTQGYVADKIGIARVTYTAYENGTKTPPPDMIKKLANLYDVSTDYLLGNSNNDDVIDDPEFEEFIQNVRRWYKEAPKDREEDLQRLKRIFEAYKD